MPSSPASANRQLAWAAALPLAAALLLATTAAADPPHARRAQATTAPHAGDAANSSYKRLHVFAKRSNSTAPSTRLTVGPDGYLYGMAYGGANDISGSAYRTSLSGETTTFYNFGGFHRFGHDPGSSPVFGSDGAIYGMTYLGWPYGSKSSIFRLTVNGSFTSLTKLPTSVGRVNGNLIRARDGQFYGTSRVPCGVGEKCKSGLVFKFNESGQFTTVHVLDRKEGLSPSGGLTEASDGSFYGMTNDGGASALGAVYRMTSNGVLTVLHEFTGGTNGARPSGELVQAANGLYYGTTAAGGKFDKGVIFSIDPAGAFSVIYSFTGDADGTGFGSSLVTGPDGYIYGVSRYAGSNKQGTAFRISTSGAFELLHGFGNHADDGKAPEGLTVGPDGQLYGSTFGGGVHNGGTVYKLTTTANLQTIHAFEGVSTPDGYHPSGGVMQASDGNMYGTTDTGTVYRMTPKRDFTTVHQADPAVGTLLKGELIEMAPGVLLGTAKTGGAFGKGTVFKMTLDGTVTVLHAFTGLKGDGAEPHGGLIKALDGNFYGTTTLGGRYGDGTIYRVTPEGAVSVLWAFNGNDAGIAAQPIGTLALGPEGALYGVTSGMKGKYSYDGTVFKITTAGEFTQLHRFAHSVNGSKPSAGLMLASNGRFYGVTREGTQGLTGTVYSISPAGDFKLVHEFKAFGELGTRPEAALIQARDGYLYGTTSMDGAHENGVAFRITLDGAPSVLHAFRDPDGSYSTARMVQGPDGALYGATFYGGKRTTAGVVGEGVVFQLDIGAQTRRPTAASR